LFDRLENEDAPGSAVMTGPKIWTLRSRRCHGLDAQGLLLITVGRAKCSNSVRKKDARFASLHAGV
jgi:hypothetical protein